MFFQLLSSFFIHSLFDTILMLSQFLHSVQQFNSKNTKKGLKLENFVSSFFYKLFDSTGNK